MSTMITNIQRFCLHDGPGIRTTIFFKGCTIKCPWCANPENIEGGIYYYYYKERCIKKNNHCDLNDNCCILKNEYNQENLKLSNEKCLVDAIAQYGNYYSSDEIASEIYKDKGYYINGGGVTFSGGEPLLHLQSIETLLRKLKNDKINMAVETALFVRKEFVEFAVQFIDYFIIDFKIANKNDCYNKIGGNIEQYLFNLKYILSNVSHNNILIRIPIIKGYTDSDENIVEIIKYLKGYNDINIQIF